jgi:rare lipoprotein A (peptidoglycan hydrolase)
MKHSLSKNVNALIVYIIVTTAKMKDMTIPYCIVSSQGKKTPMDCLLQKPGLTVMIASSAAMIRNKWPSGFLRAAGIGTLVLAICTLLVRSSEQHKQLMGERERTVTKPVYKEIGEASWYGPGFHGQETASGETFDTNKMTAAHPSLPLGTKVEVTNLEKDKTVEVRIYQ